MKVLVIGANGKVGQQVSQELQNNKAYDPVLFLRKEEQIEKYNGQGFETRLGNLEDSVSTLAKLMTDIDAVIFTAGSGGSTGADKTLLIDLDGAVKAMEAAAQNGIKRFILLSAFGAENRESWESIVPYYVAKHYADRALINSNLDYTIVKPNILIDDNGIGKIAIESFEDINNDRITRADVAKIIVTALDTPETIGQSFNVTQGNTEFKEALKQLK